VSTKFLRGLKPIPTWTCCNSTQYLRLSTWNHTILGNKTALPAYLGEKFPERWIGRKGPVPLAASFPGYYTTALVHVNSIVYQSPVTRLTTWRSESRMRTWLLTLTCSSEHGKSLNIDRTLSVLPTVPAMRCSKLKNLRVWLQATARCMCLDRFV